MHILLVDDDASVLESEAVLLDPPHRVQSCRGTREALDALERGGFDLVITDLLMPEPDGFTVLRAAVEAGPSTPVIVVTALDSAAPAVRAMELGAADYLVKPVEPARLRTAVERLSRHAPAAGPGEPRYGLVGGSPAMERVRRLIPLLAQSHEALLILGETGTGKELVARAVHSAGPRIGGPFVAHNMAATPGELAESVFFGHVRGAFSGASADHAGLFEQADGGTLFLDEVDSFPPGLQAKLLRVLESGHSQRVGGIANRALDVRVVAASSADLERMVGLGTFRADLFYRLRQLEVRLPPLRERPGDLPVLVEWFLDEIAADSDRRPRLADAARDELLRYGWPGNCRELRSTLRAAALLAGDGPVRCEHLQGGLLRGRAVAAGAACSLRAAERDHIRRVLELAEGNRSRAARLLGIDRGTLSRKLREDERA